MNLTEHTDELNTKLRDLASKFTYPGDLQSALQASVKLYSKYRPRTVRGSVSLVASTDSYAVAGVQSIMHSPWGRTSGKPWESSPGTPPVWYVDGGKIVFETAPTDFDIATWGSTFSYVGRGSHTLDATTSTIDEIDDPIITLGAQIELISDLANDSAAKSGKNGSGFSANRDETLAGRANALIDRWERMMGVGGGVLQRVSSPARGGR